MADGLLVVDKPAGWTSHDVVGRCRRIFGQKKVGHAGTLDPDATGVLLVGLGRATRLLQFLSGLTKEYVGEIVLGTSTSTLDSAGEVTGTFDMSAVTVDEVRSAAARLTGDIEQIPPMVSAVQVGGKRLHELARQGIEVERKARPVTVFRFDVTPTDDPLVYVADVACSTGTYIRTLADDVGRLLGGGAHLRNLRRTRVGEFGLEEAHPLAVVEELGESLVLPPAAALRDMPTVTVDADVAADVAHGKVLTRERLGVAPVPGSVAVIDAAGTLLAVYEPFRGDELMKPTVVI